MLAAGGFIRNTTMMERHAPRYLKTLPIGGFGDDGAEIHLGCSVGGSSDYLDRISAWRFINPPYDRTKGLIIGASGDRITNEKQYGAHLSRAIYEMSDGRAWLVVDQAIWQKALEEVRTGELFAFQQFPVKQAQKGAKSAATIAEPAGLLGVLAAPLEHAVEAYSAAARSGAPDPMGKSPACCQAFGAGPYYAVRLTHALPVSPITSLTTGHCRWRRRSRLRIEEGTGNVIDIAGSRVSGLYAAGRTAIGIPSNNYVSGLSLADCVWSGRRAGRSSAAGTMTDV